MAANKIRMKVLRGSLEEPDDEEVELILPNNKRFTNPWRSLLKFMFVSCLVAVFLVVSYTIFKEWYYLSHEARMDRVLAAVEEDIDVCNSKTGYRFDCFPAPGASEEECGKRGCCWNPNVEHPGGEPWCFYSKGFTFYDWEPPIRTTFGLQAVATLRTGSSTPYPRDIKKLLVQVFYQSEAAVQIKIFDNVTDRFEVPLEYKKTTVKSKNPTYEVKFFQDGFQVYRIGLVREETPLFDTTVAPLIFADQFLEISSALPTPYIYGLGETEDSLSRNMDWSRSVLWNHDTVPGKNKNLYGSHPFYLAMEKSGYSHGVFLANSNAMEIILQPSNAITFRTIGGILDFRIFVGPTPAAVMKEYTDTIGKPFLPPYWSLGFHLSRFNYGTLEHTQEILEKNIQAGIPIDVQWNDLDYMKNQNDFTYDKVKFKGLPDFVKSLHEKGMHYVPLIDPGISGGELKGTYPPYDVGLDMNVFVKDPLQNKPFVGKVWNPVSTVWPDFSHTNSTVYWANLFRDFHDEVAFDGAWIDMNEPSNFWDGTQDGLCVKTSNLDYPPYIPQVDGGKLFYKTICPSARQYGGTHYNLHNLYGVQETIVTSKALGDVRSERQFIISRSTFPGQGRYGGHWTGDVISSFEHMRLSIPQMLNFGLYGIPMVGADICGFNGNTTVDLCKRWQQLGAFYPFSRNHNTDDGIPQDPQSLGEEVVKAARETLSVRYSILPYIYSLFFHAYLTGEPVARPLFYEFPQDVNTFMLERTFLLGSGILIVPILDEGFTDPSLKTYLPRGWWYPHYQPDTIIESLGEEKEVIVPVQNSSIPIFYREGTILFKQKPANNTVYSRKNPFTIHAFLTSKGKASGEFFWDDGITPFPNVVGVYNHYNMGVSDRSLRVVADKVGYTAQDLTLAQIEIRGIISSVSSVVIDNVGYNFTFNQESRTLMVNPVVPLSFTQGITLTWSI